MFYIAPMMTQKNSGLTHLKAVSQPGCRLLRDYSRQQRKVLLAMLWGLRPEKPGNSLCKSPHHLQYVYSLGQTALNFICKSSWQHQDLNNYQLEKIIYGQTRSCN